LPAEIADGPTPPVCANIELPPTQRKAPPDGDQKAGAL
jgi:hypothetical protein